ncbi:hypothetical protein GJ496_003272 [Pomphorhynchus laevis]|nr:hypothetical protein GJ496_003272 [Pomphorhynchus laevis]
MLITVMKYTFAIITIYSIYATVTWAQDVESTALVRSYVANISQFPARMSIMYGSKNVENGILLTINETQQSPKMNLVLSSCLAYTLVIADPDARSPDNPDLSPFLHQYQYDITKSDLNGRFLADYFGPAPPIGIHRYVFILYEQSGVIGLLPQLKERISFPLAGFVRNYSLIAREVLYYNVSAPSNTTNW